MSHLADAQSYLIDAEDAIANGQPEQTWLELSRIHALIAIAEHGAPASPIPDSLLISEEELNALPGGSIIVDRFGDGGTVRDNTVQYYETASTRTAYAARHYGPFTLVWQPSHKNRS